MTEFRAARFYESGHFRCVLAREAHSLLHLTFIVATGVRHLALPKQQARFLRPLTRVGGEYELSRLVRRLRVAGRARGITKAASRELRAAMRATQ